MVKKIVLLLFVLLSFQLYAADLAYTPSVSLAGGYHGDSDSDSSAFFSAGYAGVKVNPLSLTIDDVHRVSIPLTVSYNTPSLASGREFSSSSIDMLIEAEYGYRFTDLFTLYGAVGTDVRWHFGSNAASVKYGGTITPSFRILDDLTVDGIVSMYGGRTGFSLSVGVGVTYLFEVGL